MEGYLPRFISKGQYIERNIMFQDGMAKLHRKYGRKVDWQGSWAKYKCLRQRGTGY
jgi:hypothetical protein